MTNDSKWSDEERDDLRTVLRMTVLGKVRLARDSSDAILQSCFERIDDECPDDEVAAFRDFVTKELKLREQEQTDAARHWPAVTDCDRLDRVEQDLQGRGIVLWQASPCCDTCTTSELTGRVNQIECRVPGFRARVRGYAFFIDQNLPEQLAEGPELDLYVGYGWFLPAEHEVSQAEYETHALQIAREVCASLSAAGFEPDWDGTLSRKIGISLAWQRRTRLE